MKKVLLIAIIALLIAFCTACEAPPMPDPEGTVADTTAAAVETTEHVHEYEQELKAPTCTEGGYFERPLRRTAFVEHT